MRYYIIAGEASGDLHASNLIRSLKEIDREGEFRGWGGDLMQQQGVELVKHYRELAFMGFAEVVAHLPQIMRNFNQCEKDLLAFAPDVLILVDYPGFNLRMAKFAHRNGLRVFYYISPQLWAWRSSRVKIIQDYVDRMFVILPFEQEFYARFGIRVDFAGHPLQDAIVNRNSSKDRGAFMAKYSLPDLPIIAMLPGSRLMEIGQTLRIMTSVIHAFPGYQFVVAAAPSLDIKEYLKILQGTQVRVVSGATYDLLEHSAAALVTSGTATLETALFNVPQVVCYRGNPVSYLIAKQLVKVPYISLVNLVCNRSVVPELIQSEFNTQNLIQQLSAILGSTTERMKMLEDYEELGRLLGGAGASGRIADLMVQYLTDK